MASQTFDDSAHFQSPYDDLSILSCARDEAIALADVDVRDEVQVAVEARLQGQRVPVPHLENPTTKHGSRLLSRI